MPTVTVTYTDTPEGFVKTHSDYHPGVGERCSRAQQASLENIASTRAKYGIHAAVPDCQGCGSNSQVWRNQITGALTCHRLGCHQTPGAAP